MATYKHLRSSTANKRPTTSITDGQLAINTNTASPGLFFKDSAGTGIVKVGPVHVGTTAPNATPAAGGSSGNYTGEQWLDTSVSPAQMKVWNGSAWVGIVADELPVSKLQDGAARQLLQTDAAGTGVEWTSNVDVPGTLDVTGATTLDSTLTVPLGSAASPTLRFSGDANSGLYSPGADQVAVATNGVGRLFVDASGNVGVGEASSPSSPLTVQQSAGNVNFELHSTSSGRGTQTKTHNDHATFFHGLAGDTSGDYIYYTADAKNHVFSTSNQERLRITSAGLVGIGTSTPPQQLSVHSASTTDGRIEAHGIIARDNWGSASGLGNGMFSPASNTLAFTTNSTERCRIDSSGRVGIGTTSPAQKLEIQNGSISIGSSSNDNATNVLVAGYGYILSGTKYGNTSIRSTYSNVNNAASLEFYVASSSANTDERMRLDSSGRLLVGTSSSNGAFASGVQIAGSSSAGTQLISAFNNNVNGGELYLAKSRSGTVGTNTVVQNGDALGLIGFYGADGTTYQPGAYIRATVDGSPGSADLPTRLEFSTTADGASSPTERMRIDSAGNTRFNSASDSATADPGVKIASSATIPEVRTVVNTADGGITNYSYYNTNATYDGYRFYVKVDGGVANHSVNNVNLSDRNVKKDISPAADTWDCIKEWEIVNYRYKNQPNTTTLNLGVIAQQVAESCPEVITVFEEAKDDQPEKLGVKEQQMMWMAIKALQEAQTRIETLEAEVAALKAS